MRILPLLFILLVASSAIPFDGFTKIMAYASEGSTEEKIIDEMQSWYFNNIGNSTVTVFGDPLFENGLLGKAVTLDGKNDFLTIENKNHGLQLSKFALSVWIKPDHVTITRDMAIVSSQNAFDLSLVKQGDERLIKFSIFDGISRTTALSNTAIPEDWTNVVATYDGTTLSIYINGRLDSSKNTNLHFSQMFSLVENKVRMVQRICFLDKLTKLIFTSHPQTCLKVLQK
ncbi:MAG: LamG domain-containing protein [Thaumarchaeota archaeon]|nr:LamG domain-containing protein [Nitrososphaerota archaeon]